MVSLKELHGLSCFTDPSGELDIYSIQNARVQADIKQDTSGGRKK